MAGGAQRFRFGYFQTDTTENIRKYALILILLVLVVVGVIFVVLLKIDLGSNNNQQGLGVVNKDFQTISPTQSQVSDDFLNSQTLTLPEGYAFSKVAYGQKTLGQAAFYYDYNPKDLKGNEWIATKNVSSDNEYSTLITNFNNYFNSWLKSLDFNTKQTVNGFKLQTLSAGSGEGSINGYLKVSGGKVQVILLENKKDKPTCPCSIEFRIFLSNVTELSTLLK